jgi:hypothetical protein
MTVKDLLSHLDSRELTEWMAFFRLEEAERENKKERDHLEEAERE